MDGEVSSQTVDSLFDFVNNAWNFPLLAATFDALSAKAIATLPPLVQILGWQCLSYDQTLDYA